MSSVKTVLVVDDDENLREMISFMLEGEGYRVETAANGKQALAVAEIHLPDLILLDVRMPVMDGYQFATEFRLRYGDQVPIVVLTAAGDARRRAEEMGVTGWMSKPFAMDTLIAVVGRFVGLE